MHIFGELNYFLNRFFTIIYYRIWLSTCCKKLKLL